MGAGASDQERAAAAAARHAAGVGTGGAGSSDATVDLVGMTTPAIPAGAAGAAVTLPPGALASAAPSRPGSLAATGTDAGPAGGPGPGELGPGARVHQFEVLRELGRGGMGQVYLARDIRLGRHVALKFLLTTTEALRERFLVEARNTARCQHEAIVVIYEVDMWDGAPYMALEYVEGSSLAELLATGPVPVARALEILIAITRALDRAHGHGLVHCDLKPDNILVARDGAIKVLDFGIARLLESATRDEHASGTPRYMSPEQWGVDDIDARTDLWALGVIAWDLLAGRHPLADPTTAELIRAAADLDRPMPRLADACAAALPAGLDDLVARCLAKRKADRFGSARELLTALVALSRPSAGARPADASPFPGLAAFSEDDADRFFGRERDVVAITTRLEDVPLVVLAGPSGVGKSSLVRAGLIPALRARGPALTTVVARPGRDPLYALAAAAIAACPDPDDPADATTLADRWRAQPGGFGERLRALARRQRQRVLVVIDQAEELFTLGTDEVARAAACAALAGAGDDVRAPVRVVLSIRADFLDKLDPTALRAGLAGGLWFVRPLGADALREALTRPLEATGFRFERPAIVDDMVAEAVTSSSGLPLAQFAAAQLWQARDLEARLLTGASYLAMGGLAGALATHAEEVVRQLPTGPRALLRGVLARLVTPGGTRAVVARAELGRLGVDADALIDRLAEARLVAVDPGGAEGDGGQVELVHESLITAWPTLRRWREEDGDDAALVAQLATAAQQWDQRGRPEGLLWRGDAITDARAFLGRYRGALAEREQAFLGAGLAIADAAARRRRRVLAASFVVLIALVGAALVAVVWVRRAERAAQDQRVAAEREATRAGQAEAAARRQLEAATASDTARRAADAVRAQAEAAAAAADRAKLASEASLGLAQSEVARTSDDLAAANTRLRRALDEANAARRKAEEERGRAAALAEERERQRQAEQRRREEAEKKASGLAKRLE
jgi:hypothetical protein